MTQIVNSMQRRMSLGNVRRNDRVGSDGVRKKPDHAYLRSRIAQMRYVPPTFAERGSLDHAKSRKLIRGKLKELLDQNDFFAAKQAHMDYLGFWEDAPLYRKQLEKKYNAIAHELWKRLERWDQKLLSKMASEINAPHRLLLRIARRWKKLGLAHVEEHWNANERRIYGYSNRLVQVLPALLYSYDMEQYTNQSKSTKEKADPYTVAKYGIHREKRAEFLNGVSQ
jgi:hypothetical protein